MWFRLQWFVANDAPTDKDERLHPEDVCAWESSLAAKVQLVRFGELYSYYYASYTAFDPNPNPNPSSTRTTTPRTPPLMPIP